MESCLNASCDSPHYENYERKFSWRLGQWNEIFVNSLFQLYFVQFISKKIREFSHNIDSQQGLN